MLEIKNYSNSILKDISFFLNSDENLLILGENGAGKSTLAKVLSNLISNNSVKIFGKNLSKISSFKRAEYINYIPPKLFIFDEYMTVKEFLENSFIKSVDINKLENTINLLKLKDLENRYCTLLSSGEKQLLLMASAILHNAKITIFDELTANLDLKRLKEVYGIFNSNSLQQKIIITHNLDLAYALKYKVLFIKSGKIEFLGSCEEFFTDKNLLKFYNNSIKKIQNHLVVDL
ncbi:ATP-binding cassette domain-containing protein [Arcobacter lacus]|uniref:Iron ABC transporter ATP-binding protein n=1 Tax=Arcobacter lacus TaxID=1912876 RepID=A0ABX5JMU2_9BACT|nr:ABC transporter ATP-binding protein [Arcobacter lacus]PUE66398.1 iron ABC transporter ATP-binding protein [Arcobacter lacus]